MTPAFAQGFGPLRYDFVAAGLVMTELDSLGIELEGSTAVTDNIVVSGRYQDFEPNDNVDRETFRIGAGYRWDIRPNVDVLASIFYADNDVDRLGRGTVDDEGIILSGEIRGWLTSRIELHGAVSLDNSVGSSTDTVVEFGGQYFGNRNRSFGGRLRTDEDDTVLILGARFYFGASRR
ncbi:MAG: hypothetical protein R3305_11095 [Gammaproteobacteria bacterium]|nr:hypothetical protein [Gammaproteobacteria bacterium]